MMVSASATPLQVRSCFLPKTCIRAGRLGHAAGCRAQGGVDQTGPKRFVVLTRLRSAGVAEGTPVARSGIWRLKGIDISE